MHKPVTYLAALVLSLPAGAPPAAGEPAPPALSDLSWISGQWQTEDGSYEEYWTPAAENAVLGMARNLEGGRMVFFEYLRIERRGDTIVYVAQPAGRPGTEFRLTRLTDGNAVFENPEHDFPRRIAYQRGRGGTLTARIDGGPGSDKPAVTFSFRRIGIPPEG